MHELWKELVFSIEKKRRGGQNEDWKEKKEEQLSEEESSLNGKKKQDLRKKDDVKCETSGGSGEECVCRWRSVSKSRKEKCRMEAAAARNCQRKDKGQDSKRAAEEPQGNFGSRYRRLFTQGCCWTSVRRRTKKVADLLHVAEVIGMCATAARCIMFSLCCQRQWAVTDP